MDLGSMAQIYRTILNEFLGETGALMHHWTKTWHWYCTPQETLQLPPSTESIFFFYCFDSEPGGKLGVLAVGER